MDEVAYYAKSQYDCPADKIVALGEDEYEACGFRFKSQCAPSLMGGGGCSFEATEDMAAENLNRQLGLFAQRELQCSEDDVIVKVDKTAVLDVGEHRLREGERALVGTGCGRTMHWVCPEKGDAKASSGCRRVSDEDLQWRSASALILQDFQGECSDKLELDRVTVDSATRVLHEAQLVVAVIARCKHDGWEATQGYRCAVARDEKIETCTRAAPGPELDASFETTARQWASTVQAANEELKILHGRPQFQSKLGWSRWTQLTTASGNGAYIRCADVLLGPAKPGCKVVRPESFFDPSNRAREICEADKKCEPGTNSLVRGAEGLASFVDVRIGPAEIVSYRCVYEVEKGRYECTLDAAAVKAFAAAKQNARKVFSAGKRAACPAKDIALVLSSHQEETRSWPFEVKGCGQTVNVTCPDDNGPCAEGALGKTAPNASLRASW